MKRTILPLVPVMLILIVLTTGCFKNNTGDTVQIPSPTGNFSGTFKLLRKKIGQATIDTLKKANIVLNLDGAGAYKVTGDTATVHAGSLGTYNFNQTYMAFTDKTAPATGAPASAKVRLYGTYLYSYDGSTNLILLINQGDTLNYRYDLKRAN